MSLTLKVKRGYTVVDNVPIDNDALNAGFLPIITLEGTVGSGELGDGAVHAINVTPDAYWYADDSNSGANLLVCTYTPAPAALIDGLLLACKVNGANTGAVTFNPNGLGAKPVYKYHDQALAAGDLEDNMIIEMRYDTEGNSGGGAWQLLTPVATATDRSSSSPSSVLDNSGAGYAAPGSGDAVLQITHGLTHAPSMVRVVLVAQGSPADGYSTGDEIDLSSVNADESGGEHDFPAWQVTVDATKIYITAAATHDPGVDYFGYLRKDTGVLAYVWRAIVLPTITAWKIKVYFIP